MTSDQITTWLKTPQVQASLRAVLSASGVVGIQLVKWGFPQASLGGLTEAVIYVAPFLIAYAWSLATKTHEAIIQKAAEIIAEGHASAGAQAAIVSATGKAIPGASVVVDTSKATPAVAALAVDPTVPGVNTKAGT